MNHLLALAGVIFISFSAILVRLADVSPSTSAFFRMAYALPLLLLLAYAIRKQDNRKRSMRWLAVGSGLILAVDLSMWHWSIGLVGAGLATVLANIQVVFVGLLGWLFLKERPSRLALAVIPMVLCGVVMTSGLGRTDAYGTDPVAGAVLGAGAGLLYAVFLILFRRSNRDRAPGAGPLLDATIGAAAGCLIAGLLDPGFSLHITFPSHIWLITLALCSQVTGWLLITNVLPRLPALETSILLVLQPILTVIWGLILFTELPSPVQWTGVMLVLTGITVLTLKGSVGKSSG
jgi:drug/metabolite transporter (DMT)-like permease